MSNSGRPRALDESKRREICALVSAGAGIRAAARYVGCSQSTICREAKRDKSFGQRLRKAKATVCLTSLQAMRQATQSDWRAAAWVLERTDPEAYGRSYRHAFGRRELQALARDLVSIVQEEVDHPIHRERAIERLQAAINYAMHHAWDKQRSGKALNQAMEYFAKKNQPNDEWADFDFSRESKPETEPRSAFAGLDIASLDDLDFAKGKPSESCDKEKTTRNPGSSSESAA